ncbi:TetR family transcriptional regulator [Pseudonocardia eucalypti]|uniref:TetR family transcriptional regulator n=1 Tax=Pseudonocardia eucalypti TaxID=648755 RepID=A0ABP9PKS0_9PSEU|nr:AcrR family transcriptional regulator [Pseudonocardia eucalypti]
MTELGLRERRQRRQRAELVSAGMRLFAERGFDATTVDEVADAAGVSRRTLFRYFGSKGDIVMEWARGTTSLLTAALRTRPLAEEPLTSLHAAFAAMCASIGGSSEDIRSVIEMIERSPSLRPYSLLKHARWEDALAELLAERRPELDPMRAALLARVSVAAFRTALDEWLRAAPGEADPLAEVNRAFALLTRLCPADAAGER